MDMEVNKKENTENSPAQHVSKRQTWLSPWKLYILKKLLLYIKNPKEQYFLDDFVTCFDPDFYQELRLIHSEADCAWRRSMIYNKILSFLFFMDKAEAIGFSFPFMFVSNDDVWFLDFTKTSPEHLGDPTYFLPPDDADEGIIRDRIATVRPRFNEPMKISFLPESDKRIHELVDKHLDLYEQNKLYAEYKKAGQHVTFMSYERALEQVRKVFLQEYAIHASLAMDIQLNMRFRPENKGQRRPDIPVPDQPQPDWFVEPEIRVIETLCVMERKRLLEILGMDPSVITIHGTGALLEEATAPITESIEKGPCFDEESGWFIFRGQKTKLRRSSYQYKLVQLLYNNPNRQFSYAEIAVQIGLIEKVVKKAADPKLLELYQQLKQKEGDSATFIKRVHLEDKTALVPITKKINDCVNEIRTKLHLPPKDESLFICNDGYMMIREVKTDDASSGNQEKN